MSINAPIIPGAVMLDRVLGEIQQGLADGLPWLDAAFGRAQRIVRITADGKRLTLPNVYCGGWRGHGPNDYIEVSPDSHIGNFSFFLVDDPQTLDTDIWARHIRTPFSLVVWFDLRKVYGEETNRNIEFLKAQVLRLLEGRDGWTLSDGRVTIGRIFEQNENIYRGFSLQEVDNQYLMHPYGGFRLEGTLEYDELCLQ